MRVGTLVAEWSGLLTARPTARKRLSSLRARLAEFGTAWGQTLVQAAFGLFVGGLVALLVLLYSDILII